MARQQVRNYEIATDAARLNLLTNGGFEIWQRGNGPFNTNNAYTADRWQVTFGAGSTASVSQSGSANADNSGQCLAFTFTGGGGYTNLAQNIENSLVWSIWNGRTVTFSIRVKTTGAGVRAFIYQGSNQYSTAHTGDGTYQTLIVTRLMTGTTPVNVGLELNTGSGVAYVDNAMLVMGSVAADYAPLHPADDLARCLRYYEIIGASSAASVVLRGYCGSLAALQSTLRFTKKPVTPTVTKVGTWTVSNASQPTVPNVDLDSTNLTVTNTGTAGDTFANNNGGGACITIESNP